jgi:hypothetical protein
MRRPSKHIAMINRCLSNRDAIFTGAVEKFLGDSFGDVWWWSEHVPRKEAGPPGREAKAESEHVDILMPLLSAAVRTSTAAAEKQATSCEIEVAVQHVAQDIT